MLVFVEFADNFIVIVVGKIRKIVVVDRHPVHGQRSHADHHVLG
jgi:hypothetical protein